MISAIHAVSPSQPLTIAELVETFLASPASQTSDSRRKITVRFLSRFVERFGEQSIESLRVGGADAVQKWIDGNEAWQGCRADVVGRLRRLFNWAVAANYVHSSPIAALKKPRYNVRVATFTPEQVDAVLATATETFSEAFRLLLLTGCRPEEICTLEASSIREDASGLYLLVKHKNQRLTGRPRRVFLVPEAAAIVRRLAAIQPHGRLLRSSARMPSGERKPIGPEYLIRSLRAVCAEDACSKLGLNEYAMIGGKRQYRYVVYTARHTFAVRYLTGFYRDASGRPIVLNYGEVAALMGNKAKMVEEVYGHLCDQTSFLTRRLTGAAY